VRRKRTIVEASALKSYLSEYSLTLGRYVHDPLGSSLFTSPVPNNWSGPYLKKKKMPIDPWGNKYVYVSPGTNNTEEYDLSSYGADGAESADDITNWFEDEDIEE